MYKYLLYYGFSTYPKDLPNTQAYYKLTSTGRIILDLDFEICNESDITKVTSILKDKIDCDPIEDVVLFSFSPLKN